MFDVLFVIVLSLTALVFMNYSAGVGDAASLGRLSHHVSGGASLCSFGLDICLSLDEKKNSK